MSCRDREREGGSARLKRIWQSEVTGPGREEEEAGVAEGDKSLVTKTAGLRYKVSWFCFFSVCSYVNLFLFSQSVRILELILKVLKEVYS